MKKSAKRGVGGRNRKRVDSLSSPPKIFPKKYPSLTNLNQFPSSGSWRLSCVELRDA